MPTMQEHTLGSMQPYGQRAPTARQVCAVLAALGAFFSTACVKDVQRAAAREATDQFHAALNHGQEDAVCELLTAEARQMTPCEQVVDSLRAFRESAGDYKEPRSTRERWAKSNTGTYIIVTLESNYARGDVREHFSWRVLNGTARLDSYTARSPALATPIRLGRTWN